MRTSTLQNSEAQLSMTGFVDFVEEHYEIKATIVQDDFFLDREMHEYRIFYLPADAAIRSDPEWGLDKVPPLND